MNTDTYYHILKKCIQELKKEGNLTPKAKKILKPYLQKIKDTDKRIEIEKELLE